MEDTSGVEDSESDECQGRVDDWEHEVQDEDEETCI